MLNYYRPIQTIEGYTLSIDKMTIDYRMDNLDSVTALGQLLDMLPVYFAVATKHWEHFRIGSFRENYTITFQNGDSFWLGAVLNGARVEYNRVRLEFNPNKCVSHDSFLSVLGFLNQHSRPMHTAIKRFDLAVDICILPGNMAENGQNISVLNPPTSGALNATTNKLRQNCQCRSLGWK